MHVLHADAASTKDFELFMPRLFQQPIDAREVCSSQIKHSPSGWHQVAG